MHFPFVSARNGVKLCKKLFCFGPKMVLNCVRNFYAQNGVKRGETEFGVRMACVCVLYIRMSETAVWLKPSGSASWRPL